MSPRDRALSRTTLLAVAVSAPLLCRCSAPSGSTGTPTPEAPDPSVTESAQAPGKLLEGVMAQCQPWAEILDGPFKYVNDQWGSSKAKGPFEQCLMKRPVEDGIQYGWTWAWPGYDPTVFAYPSITFGWKPWAGGAPTDARFPMRVRDIERLTLTYEIEMEAEGTYNLAPEIWFTKSLPSSQQADPSLITREVMIWMDYRGDIRPAGSVVGHPTIDGTTYELWNEDNIGADANGQGWRVLSLKSPGPRHAATLDLHALLQQLVENEMLPPDEFVASIEFGAEVMGGRGTTWIKRLEIEVEP